MDEPQQSVNWLTYVLGLLMALLASIFEIYRRKVDDHAKTHITREELEGYLERDRDHRLEMHRDNTKRLERIEDRVNEIGDR